MLKKTTLLFIIWLSIVGCTGSDLLHLEPTAVARAVETLQAEPAATAEAPTDTPTPLPPTNTSPPPTETPLPPTNTPLPTATPLSPTSTPLPTDTPVPPPPTNTPLPPTEIPLPTDTPPPPPPAASSAGSALQHFEKGFEHFQNEQWDEAIASLEQAIILEPDFSLAYQYVGLSYAFKGEFEIGIANLERYLQLSPEANNRAEVEAMIQDIRNVMTSPAADLPPGKGGIVMQNCRGDDITVDIIPIDIFLELPRRTEQGCTRSEVVVLDPGEYATRASIPGVPSLGEGPFTIEAGRIQEFTWY